jgi:hypothetical protein
MSFIFDISTAIYQIYISSLFDSTSQQPNVDWSPDELHTLEKFLNENFFPLSSISNLIVPSIDILSLQASQNLSTAMGSFERMMSLIHPRILKDLVNIIRLEQVYLTFAIRTLTPFRPTVLYKGRFFQIS